MSKRMQYRSLETKERHTQRQQQSRYLEKVLEVLQPFTYTNLR